ADHADLLDEVLHGEVAGEQLLGVLLGLLLVDDALEVPHQADPVAEAEDAAGEAVGAELLEAVEVLAHAEELDGLAGDLLDGEGGTTAGVTIQLGEDESVQVEAAVELGGGLDRVLADHRVADEQDVVGAHRALDGLELHHQLLVDGEATGGVEEHHVALLGARGGEALGGQLGRGEAGLVEDGHVEALTENLELVHGSRAVDVRGDEQRLAPFFDELLGELAGGGRLSRALEADHHDAAHLALGLERQGGVDGAHEGLELVVADLDEPVPGRDLALLAGGVGGLELHHLADGLLADAGDELLDDV